uniref:Uncharacterized protein n=1 Tax=Photinus pyralis TaxID=7054 RepID=A0A1Y1LM92_PHOPY
MTVFLGDDIDVPAAIKWSAPAVASNGKASNNNIPKAGPRKGAIAKTLVAIPRSLAVNRSAMIPPELVSGEDPHAPAMKRNTMRAAMFGAPAAAALKAVRAMYVREKSFCRP